MTTDQEDQSSESDIDETQKSSPAKDKKKYELMIIISSEITDQEIEKRLKGIKELLGSEITYEEIWGIRDFAYPIKNQSKGYYVVLNFILDSHQISELKELLKLYPDLLRYLIVKIPEDYKAIPLAEIEKGLEKLLKEKAEKRAGKSTSATKAKKPDKKTEKTIEESVEDVVKEKTTEEIKEEKKEEVQEADETKEEAGEAGSPPAKEESEEVGGEKESEEVKEEEKAPEAEKTEVTEEEKPAPPASSETEKSEAEEEKKKSTLDEKLEKILAGDDFSDLGL